MSAKVQRYIISDNPSNPGVLSYLDKLFPSTIRITSNRHGKVVESELVGAENYPTQINNALRAAGFLGCSGIYDTEIDHLEGMNQEQMYSRLKSEFLKPNEQRRGTIFDSLVEIKGKKIETLVGELYSSLFFQEERENIFYNLLPQNRFEISNHIGGTIKSIQSLDEAKEKVAQTYNDILFKGIITTYTAKGDTKFDKVIRPLSEALGMYEMAKDACAFIILNRLRMGRKEDAAKLGLYMGISKEYLQSVHKKAIKIAQQAFPLSKNQ